MSFVIIPKTVKYLWVTITKQVKDLYDGHNNESNL